MVNPGPSYVGKSTWLNRVMKVWYSLRSTNSYLALHLQLGSIIRRVYFVSLTTTDWKLAYYLYPTEVYRLTGHGCFPSLNDPSFPHHHPERQARIESEILSFLWWYSKLDFLGLEPWRLT